MAKKFCLYTIILLLSLGNLISCRKAADNINRISKDEYEVYSAVLLQSENVYFPGRFVVEQLTSGLHLTPKPSLVESETSLAFRTRDLEMKQKSSIIKDFILKNTKSYSLANRFSHSLRVVLISKQEQSEIFSETNASEDGWAEFRKRYPNSGGIIQFSRVGFNEDRDQALVYCGELEGPIGGGGNIVFLVREKNKWIIAKELMTWIS